LVTDPEEFAIGLAVALTPPTVSAFTGVAMALAASSRHSFLAIE
jgi:hypothetical protein